MQIFCCKIEESKGLSYIHCSCGEIWKTDIQKIRHRHLAMYWDSTSGNLNTYSSPDYTHAINLGHWQVSGITWMYLCDSGWFLMESHKATVWRLGSAFVLHYFLSQDNVFTFCQLYTEEYIYLWGKRVNLSWLQAEKRMKKLKRSVNGY